jgi:hypothetical protein
MDSRTFATTVALMVLLAAAAVLLIVYGADAAAYGAS